MMQGGKLSVKRIDQSLGTSWALADQGSNYYSEPVASTIFSPAGSAITHTMTPLDCHKLGG
jgi:hypothetical protein